MSFCFLDTNQEPRLFYNMEIHPTAIPDVKLVRTTCFTDVRGYFAETYRKHTLEAAGVVYDFVQDNQSFSSQKGVIRGLHFQIPPHAQTKLVRVLRGAIFDVAVDIRRNSPTFGQHVGFEIRADQWNQLLVPKGFAHGFCTLESDTEVFYKVDDYWFPECERGIRWNDPALGIAWPVRPGEALLSERDSKLPRLSEVREFFE